MSREAALWQWLRAGLPAGAHACRVENRVCPGYPDVEACHLGRAAWIELKSVDRAVCPQTVILPHKKYRRNQAAWLQRRWTAGGRAYLLVQVSGRGPTYRYLVPGFNAEACLQANEAELRRLGHYDLAALTVWRWAFGED